MWVIKYYVCYNPILVRICMCDNKNLSGKIYTGVPTVVVSCVVFLNFLFTSIFFFYNETILFCNKKKSYKYVVSSHLQPLLSGSETSSTMRFLLAIYNLATEFMSYLLFQAGRCLKMLFSQHFLILHELQYVACGLITGWPNHVDAVMITLRKSEFELN